MNTRIMLHCDDEMIDEFNVPVGDVLPYLELIKKYGYEDMSGEEYEYVTAVVEGMSLCVSLTKKEKDE